MDRLNQTGKTPAVNYVVCLRTSEVYKADYVVNMAGMVNNAFPDHAVRFVCISDNADVPGYKKSETNWPGWWIVIEAFRVRGPVICTGLDSLLLGNLGDLANLALSCPANRIYMLRPFNKTYRDAGGWASGIMVWNGDWTWIPQALTPHDIATVHGEQEFTSRLVNERKAQGTVEVLAVQDFIPGVVSYKKDVLPLAAIATAPGPEVRVVLFHGDPRIHVVTTPWVVEAWCGGAQDMLAEAEEDRLLQIKRRQTERREARRIRQQSRKRRQ